MAGGSSSSSKKKKGGGGGDNRNKKKDGNSSSNNKLDTSLSITAILTPIYIFSGIIFAMILSSQPLRNKVLHMVFGNGDNEAQSSSTSSSFTSLSSNHQGPMDINKRNVPSPKIEALFDTICGNGNATDATDSTSRGADAYCHESLFIDGRVLRVKERVDGGSTSTSNSSMPFTAQALLRIPRTLQIWDLDAMRDPFIREELIHASHTMTGNHLSSGAFLAAYIALQLQQLTEGYTLSNLKLITNPIKIQYLMSLPTMEDLQSYHPVLWDKDDVAAYILKPSVLHNVIQSYRNMVISEYDALIKISTTFGSIITREVYAVSRVNILSRAIYTRTKPKSPEEQQQYDQKFPTVIQPLEEELKAYKDLLNIDFTNEGHNRESNGCLALVPIADLLNHHPNSNVESNYVLRKEHEEENEEQKDDGVDGNDKDQTSSSVSSSSSLVVTVRDGTVIESGTEPIISYGSIADSQLFGRYGFNNGDGSGMTQVSLAHNHDVLNLNISSQYNYIPYSGITSKILNYQKPQLLKYLRHDDGYEYCVSGITTHPEEATLKKLKFQHLIKIANIRDRWIVYLPPRNNDAIPNNVILNPLYYTREQAYDSFNIEPLLSTCRLISLINSDYDGQALNMLKSNLENADTYVLPEGNEALEFRSLMCIGRWIGSSLLSSELAFGNINTILDSVRQLNLDDYGSRNWTSRHVLFGEMQAYHSIRVLALEKCEEKWSHMKHNPPVEFIVRDDECPEENYKYLLLPDAV